MATTLGDAWIELELKTDKAERQLSEMERRVKKADQKRATVAREVAAEETKASGLGGFAGPKGRGVTRSATESLMDSAQRRMERAAMSSPAARFAQGAAASRFLPPGLAAPAKMLGVAALAYGAANLAANTLPLLTEGMKQLLPKGLGESDAFKGFESGLEELRQSFAKINAIVVNAFKSVGQTNDQFFGGLRLTGQAPDWFYYYGQNFEVGRAKDELESKFNHFKRMEVAGGLGAGLDRTLSGGLQK